MSRYIDADKVLEKMRNTIEMQDLYLPIHFKELIIDDMPTAEVVPKEKYDRLLENAIILANAVRKYEKMFEQKKEVEE